MKDDALKEMQKNSVGQRVGMLYLEMIQQGEAVLVTVQEYRNIIIAGFCKNSGR